jgi:hypothetical protein
LDITPYFGGIVSAAVFVVGAYVAMKNANERRFAAIEAHQARQDERIDRTVEDARAINGLSQQIAGLSAKLDDLAEDVRRHNDVVERTYRVEGDLKTAFHRIDELREDIKVGGTN